MFGNKVWVGVCAKTGWFYYKHTFLWWYKKVRALLFKQMQAKQSTYLWSFILDFIHCGMEIPEDNDLPSVVIFLIN